MAQVRVLVLRAAGVNCDEETALAWELAGARAERIHVNRLLERPTTLDAFQILTIPGGFSYGDDIASGKVLAVRLAHRLGEAIEALRSRGGLILGVCNGFQVLVRMGLLPGPDGDFQATLALNDSGHYEDRWVYIRAERSFCPWFEAGEVFHVPVAHAEGRLVVAGGEPGCVALRGSQHVSFRYVRADGGAAGYPDNPNGSTDNAAGLTDSTGRVLGLMPHPERALYWRPGSPGQGDINAETDGLRFYRRIVRSLQ